MCRKKKYFQETIIGCLPIDFTQEQGFLVKGSSQVQQDLFLIFPDTEVKI